MHATMDSACQAYLEAAASQKFVGSDRSTATGCSTSGISSSSSGTPLSTSSLLRRTPISSQAKPFIPSSSLWQSQPDPSSALPGACQVESLLLSLSGASVLPSSHIALSASSPDPPCIPTERGAIHSCKVETYSEHIQEDMYLADCSHQNQKVYSECLQESVYLSGVDVAVRVGSAGDYQEQLQERVYCGGSRRVSRTPSPLGWQGMHPVVARVARAAQHSVADALASRRSPPEVVATSCSTASACAQAQDAEDGVPVKRTFIHYDEQLGGAKPAHAGAAQRCPSAPPVLCLADFRLRGAMTDLNGRPNRESEAHLRGECRPCAYFFYKEDGCRMADECKFCHFCGPGELKKRKKEKKDRLRGKSVLSQTHAASGTLSNAVLVAGDAKC